MQLIHLAQIFCAAASVLAAPIGAASKDVHIVKKDASASATLIVDEEKRAAAADAAADVLTESATSAAAYLVSLLDPDNFDIIKFTEAFIAFIIAPATTILPARIAGTLLPKLNINENMILSELFVDNWEEIPGWNTVYEVPNVESGRAVWFAEAENRTADDPVLLYAHGGGYVVGFYPFFVLLMSTIYSALGNSRLSILMLDYTLTLDEVWPQQLNEFVETYNELSKTSNNIAFVGDSAGAHLCLQFLRHQKYEAFDGVPAAVQQDTAGAVFISPWVNVYPDETGTFVTNFGKDILTAPLMQHATEINFPEEWQYTDPAFNPYKDHINWDDVLPESMFVSRGESEVLYDSITNFTIIANFGDNDVVFTDPDGIHDAAIFTPAESEVVDQAITYLQSIGY